MSVVVFVTGAAPWISNHGWNCGPAKDWGINMRFNNPLARNPWPRGLVIGVNTHPFELNLLLYIRHAWKLADDANIPDLAPQPNAGNSQAPDTATHAEWERRWYTAWDRSWTWYQNDYNPSQPLDSSPEDERLWKEAMHRVRQPGQPLHPIAPPLWTSEYGWAGIDLEAFNTWDGSLAPRPPIDAENPNLANLIPAWESGLESIIVLPYAGYFADRVTPRHLAVSAFTRSDPTSYSQALQLRWVN